MYVSALFVDRFGRRANLRFDSLCDGLNLIAGPQGSGKTTLLDFLRAMWQGFDPDLRAKYLPRESRGFGGAITIQTPEGQQSISRYDDGSREGRLTVEREDGSVIGRRQLADLKGHLPADLLDRAFFVDFRRRPGLTQLLRVAAAEKLLHYRPASSPRVQELEQQLLEKRERLAKLPASPESRERLQQQRAEISHEISNLLAAHANAADEYRRRRALLEQEWTDLERRVTQLRGELEEHDRSRPSATSLPAVDPSARLRQLQELDLQLASWKQTLGELLRRKRTAALEARKPISPLHDSVAGCMKAVDDQLDDLTQNAARLGSEEHCICREVRGELTHDVGALRREIGDLHATLRERRLRRARRQAATECRQLATSARELRQSIRFLAARRKALIRQSAELVTEQITEPSASDVQVNFDRWKDARRRIAAELDHVRDQAEECRLQLERLGKSVHDSAVLESLRAKLGRVESLLREHDLRQQLLLDIASLEDSSRRLRQELDASDLLHDASRYLRRLTAGEHTVIHATGTGEVVLENGRGGRARFDELDAGTRDQVYLACCLAVAVACDRKGIRFPLVFNDLFANYPSKHVHDALELLQEFAAGRQILCLTRHEHVVSEAGLLNIPVHRIRERGAEEPIFVEPLREPIRRVVARNSAATSSREAAAARASLWDAEEFPGELTDRVREYARSLKREERIHHTTAVRPANEFPPPLPETPATPAPLRPNPDEPCEGATSQLAAGDEPALGNEPEYFLYEHDPIDRAPSIDGTNAARLRGIGVMRVGDLLRVSATEIARELQVHGITAEMVQSWRYQARLMCEMRGLRSYDARILVGCGLTDPAQLRTMSSAALRARIRNFAQSVEGQTILLSGTEAELSRVTDWIRVAAEDQDESRSTRYLGQPREAVADTDEHETIPASSTVASKPETRGKGRPARGTPRSTPRRGASRERWQLRESDLVERGPSIGSVLAGRLEKIGIKTVGDLLSEPAERIAAQLQMQRITPRIVHDWQCQANFCCRVAEIRGRDAKILTAIGVNDLTLLAAMSPGDLWNHVQEYCDSLEGRRLLGQSDPPRQAEVESWIQGARQIPALHAA